MASESPHVRRRPTRARPRNPQRDSNIVRASVLETALELGFGQNSTVAHWIFNNPLSEEPEDHSPKSDDLVTLDLSTEPAPDDVEVIVPSLVSGSNSTSDETSSLNSPSNNAPSAAVQASHTRKPSITESPHVHFGDFSSDQLQLFSPFDLTFQSATHGEPRSNLLEKPPKDVERSRSQDDGLRHYGGSKSPSPGLGDSGYASEGQYLSKGNPSKEKDKIAKTKGKGPKHLETPKASDKDGDYLSDGGYISASSNKSQGKSSGKVKSRAMAFFRRRPKKSARVSDDEDEDGIPPVPAIPVLPRPSSPKLFERRAAPSSPSRSGFTPLSLNLTNPPISPPRKRMSKSPPPPAHVRSSPPQRLDLQRSSSPLVASSSAPIILTPASTAATFPLPPSIPGTPLSTASFPVTSAHKSLATSSSRQHLAIPPPTPPPTLPLPHPPPSPTTQPNGALPPLPPTPNTSSRRGAPSRPIPVVPIAPGSTQPLTPRRAASPLRPLLSHRTLPPALSHVRNGELAKGLEGDQPSGKEATGRQGSGLAAPAGLSSAPAFLQRRILHCPPPSPRRPPPDIPLPPSPCPAQSIRPRTPIGPPSKFHEHLSSVSSVPLSHALSATSISMSPSISIVTLSESSSGRSLRSSHISSASECNEETTSDSLNMPESSRPTTSASIVSEASSGRLVSSTFSRPRLDVKRQLSERSDLSPSIYSSAMRRDNNSIGSFYDDNDADIDDSALKSRVDEEDDDASLYPSDDKTAGRRTMYLLEHGEMNEDGEEVVHNGSRYWNDREIPPPLPPLPSMPTRPRPGYF